MDLLSCKNLIRVILDLTFSYSYSLFNAFYDFSLLYIFFVYLRNLFQKDNWITDITRIFFIQISRYLQK